MTIEAPDFDPDLSGHSAVVLDGEDGPVCHALVSAYPDGEPEQQTECGIGVPSRIKLDTDRAAPRQEFTDDDADMCPACWPSSAVE